MGQLFTEGLGDYQGPNGVVRLPDAVASYLGLSRAQPSMANDPVYPPESDGAAPPIDHGSLWDAKSPADTVIDTAQREAAIKARAALPENVRNGTYDTYDPSDIPPSPTGPIVAQRAPTGAHIGQQGPTDIYGVQGAGNTAGAGFSQQDRDDLAKLSAPQTSAPQDQPATEQGLRDTGVAGALNAANKATDIQGDAARALADSQADEQIKFANAYDARNTEIDKQLAARAAEAQKNSAAIDQRMAEYDGATKAYADSKIDRSIDHPILAAISLALGAIGSVMKNDGTNPALDILLKQIERKAQAQMAERDRLGQVASMKRTDVDMLRQRANDKNAQYNLVVAGEIEKASRQMEAIAARSQSEQVKLQAQGAIAQLQARKADALGSAVMAQTGKDERDRSFAQQQKEAALQDKRAQQGLYLQQKGMDQSDRHFDEDMKFKREQLDADKQAALLAAQAKGNEAGTKQMFEMQKLNEERGVGNVATGDPLLQPEGVKMLDEAKGMEDKAKQFTDAAAKETDPAKKQQLEDAAKLHQQKASEIRGEATLKYQFRARSAEQAQKLGDIYGGTQTALSLMDDIKRGYKENGPGWLKTNEGQAAMQSKSTALMMQLKNAWQLGVLSKSDEDLLNRATGGDPNKLTWGHVASTFGVDGPGARLDALGDALTKNAQNQMRQNGYRGEIKFNRTDYKAAEKTDLEKASGKISQSRTPIESEAGKAPNAARKALQDADTFLQNGLTLTDHEPQYKKEARDAAENGSIKYVGYGKDAERALDQLFAAYNLGGKPSEEATKIIMSHANSDNPADRNAMRAVIKEYAPDLAKQVEAQPIPDDMIPSSRLVDEAIAAERNGDSASADRAKQSLYRKMFPPPGVQIDPTEQKAANLAYKRYLASKGTR
jgi:hypothetical protein